MHNLPTQDPLVGPPLPLLPDDNRKSAASDLLIVCCFAAIGLAATFGLAEVLPRSSDLIAVMAQVGG